MTKLTKYIKEVHAVTGRFDQKPIDAAHPKPSGIQECDALIVIGAMCSAVDNNPDLAADVLPNESGTYPPSGMGTVWSELENMTLAHEMLIIVKDAYRIKKECEALNVSPSKRIGELRRGIFGKMSKIFNEKYGMDRSEAACKNQWYRELRERTYVDERIAFDCGGKRLIDNRLSVSLNVSNKYSFKSTALNKSPSKPKGITKKTSPIKQRNPIQTKLDFAVIKSNEQSIAKHDEMFEPAEVQVQTHQFQRYHYEDIPELPLQPWEVEAQFHQPSYHSPYYHNDYANIPPSDVVQSIEVETISEANAWVPPTWEELANIDQSQFEIDPSIIAV
jgi:hypothetical protein